MRIVVIGAGLLGISTAFFLRNSGHEVVVVDRNPGPGMDTSFANGGMLTPSQAGPWNSPGIFLKLLRWSGRNESPLSIHPRTLISLLPWGLSFLKKSSAKFYRENLMKNALLAAYSLQTLQQIIQQIPVSYDRSCRGTLKIFRSGNDFHQARSMLESVTLEQIYYELLDNDEVIKLEPSLSAVKDQIAGGIYYPHDEVGDAYQFCNEIARIAADQGVVFQYRTSIHRLLSRERLIQGLDTSSGLLDADCYVLAAGSYSPELASTVGLKLPIKPVKGYSVTFKQKPGIFVPVIPVIDESRHIAFTPFSDRLRISGTAELCGYDTSVNEKRVAKLLVLFKEIFPELSSTVDLAAIDSWCGLRPYCSDGIPILGSCEISNLFLNTGHGHLGWTMAAGSGKLIADLICKGRTDLDINPFNIKRFSRQRF
jgi:D-amino-acid dehydrogenase